MYTYTLGFIKKNNQILLINREKEPWMGSWNGLGGKLHPNETPKACIIREIKEEASIIVDENQIIDKGILTWNTFDAKGQGLYLFLIHVDEKNSLKTPKIIREGLLDWKTVDWILNDKNYGIAHNIPYFLNTLINDNNRYHYHCHFENQRLISVTKELISCF